MPIACDEILKVRNPRRRLAYGDRDTILYALAVGFGRDPMDPAELPYVCEHAGLKAAPTMATLFADTRGVTSQAGIDHSRVVHAEQKLTLHRPMPAASTILVDERVVGAFDKGPDKGALIVIERTLSDEATGEMIATVLHTLLARGDGGFGGPRSGATEPHRLPTRPPDLIVESKTRKNQALLYALCGDRNPLHRDPSTARAAGFARPILHGLCTYGIVGRAILGAACGYDNARITGFDARFSSPVIPGETILTEAWLDGRVVSFRARAKPRDVLVLDFGKCTLSE